MWSSSPRLTEGTPPAQIISVRGHTEAACVSQAQRWWIPSAFWSSLRAGGRMWTESWSESRRSVPSWRDTGRRTSLCCSVHLYPVSQSAWSQTQPCSLASVCVFQGPPQRKEWSLCTASSWSPCQRSSAPSTPRPSSNNTPSKSCANTCRCTATQTAGTCWHRLATLHHYPSTFSSFLIMTLTGLL